MNNPLDISIRIYVDDNNNIWAESGEVDYNKDKYLVKEICYSYLPPERNNPIDNITLDYLDIGLRVLGIHLDKVILDKVLDIMELLVAKGGQLTIDELTELKEEYKKK